MGYLVSLLFKPPPIPAIDLPIPARMIPAVKLTIAKALELVYYRGLWDGFIAGFLVATLFLPSIRSSLAKGASHVAEHL